MGGGHFEYRGGYPNRWLGDILSTAGGIHDVGKEVFSLP